ncbi:abnormal spindle-like microcephaly-associated protein homolog isoform X2 [Haliotis rufescens]|uniref:abnormal spindle-like microcephaly-associated protein homolog isoform X2 n=1 Tax=Haliotis rufescens TaxID=6454 RepID=UPI00201E813D|nr:abnormal spindle-like microcephaly-associated protein homolog isoform X2 [Haliotis rufescens]
MDKNPVSSVTVDSAWQSLNNVCDDLEQTATPSRRRSRKSWFETPPATKLEIACEKKKRRSSGGGKRKSMENMETLLLTHFTNPPKITFGKIKLGKSRHRHLLVKNVHDYEQSVVIEKFPHKKKFEVDSKSFTVPALDSVVITFSWTPEEDGNVREMILFRVDSAYRLQAFLLGCADSPKPAKKGKKGLLGAKVKRPFSILHTPGLACIRDNYSPQEAEKEPFIPGKFRVLQENTHVQNQNDENRRQHQAFPPPRLESTAITKDANSSICRSSVYNKMADLGCSPTLPVSDFSPIPTAESENIHLVDSCCSIMQTSPLREVVINRPNEAKTKDMAKLEPRGPDVKFSVLDRKEIIDVEVRETVKDPQKTATPSRTNDLRSTEQVESQKEYLSPDSFLNDSLVFRQPLDRKETKDTEGRSVIRKPRKSWTPQKMSPLRISDPDKSEKRYLSPDSFLNDSLASRISGIGATPGKPYFDTTPDFSHDDFEKSIISPNSFLEELSSTRNDSLDDRRFSRIPSPGSVLNGSVPHDIIVKQLKSVRTSLYEKKLERESMKTQNVKFTVASKTTRQTSTNCTKKTGVFAPTLSSSRRATFVSKKADKEMFSGAPNAPSPRRATFLVSKKKQVSKKVSPQKQEPPKGQKKMTRSQRFTNIHKAGQLEQKTMSKSHSKVRRRSSGNGESLVKKTRKSRTEVFLTSVEASDAEMKENQSDDDVVFEASVGNQNSSATITKDRPFMMTSDMERSSGRQLFAEEDVKDSSATVTKERPFMEVTEERRVSGKCLFAVDGNEFEQNSSATVTKEKPSVQLSDARRGSGKQLFADETTKIVELEQISSATVTKERPSVEMSDVRRGSGKQLFADEKTKIVELEQISSATVTKERPSVEMSDVRRGSGKQLFADEEAKDVRGMSSVNDAEKAHSELTMTADLVKEQQILSSLEKVEFGSPSKMFNNVFVGESCVGRMSMTVTKERPSLSVIPKSVSGEGLSTTSKVNETPKSFTQASISGIFSKDPSLNGNNRRFSGKKLFGADPMSPSKSPILSSIFRDIGSPSRIPSSPDVEVTRRITLTVTKSRPSDALIEATKATVKDTGKTDEADGQFVVAAKEETFVNVSESKEGYCKRKKIMGTAVESENANYSFKKVDTYEKIINVSEMQAMQEQTRSWEVTSSPQGRARSNSYTITSPMFSVTPTAIPSSPSSENSRRSTQVILKPKVLDVSANPRRLFPPLDNEEQDSLVVGELEEQRGASVSSITSASSVYSADSLEARKSVSEMSDSSQSKSVDLFENSSDRSKKVTDEPIVEAGKLTSEMSDTSRSKSIDLFDKLPDHESKKENEPIQITHEFTSDDGSLSTSVDVFEKTPDHEAKETFEEPVCQEELSMNESVFERNENAENIPPITHAQQKVVETGLEPRNPEIKETMNLLKASKKSTPDEQPKEEKKRRKVRASKVSPTPVKSDISPSKSVKDGKENRRMMFIAMDTADKDKCVKAEVKRQEKKPLLSRGLNLMSKKRTLTVTDDKENGEKQNSKKRSKSDPTENTQPKRPGFLSRLTATTKKSKPPVKGLAQSKLILVKKGKQGMPRHPLPYAAKNMYYDERWMEKQDRGFVHWLNFVLTPPDEYNYVVNKIRVDAGTLNTDIKTSACLAPTKEVLSIRAYTARRRLNRLRRAACQLYQSEKTVSVILKLEYEVEKKRISVRRDRMVHADIGIKQRILDMLLCYNPLWLRVGLETVYGEVLPLQSNSDVIGLSRYILCRLLGNPDIAQEYAHPSVPHLYRDGYAEAIAKHALKKFLLIVYFLDHAKTARLIQHDPCLFCKDSDVKASKDMLTQFSRDYLSGEGDVTKHLAYFGYTVSHVQTAMDEFDYAVTKLGVDLRDGVRLSRVLELLTGEWNLVKCLRAPAVSRLQKIHNIEMVFRTLTERGLDVAKVDGGKIGARDVVDGHREKTLKILWHLIFHFQVDVLINLEQLREETSLLEQSLRVKVNMQKLLKIKQEDNLARRDSGGLMSQDNERLEMLLKWCRVVCLHYGVKVENFTVSFSDGRALCCLLHHYHPGLLPLSQVRFQTSQSRQQDLEDKEEAACDLDLSQDWSFQYGSGLDDPELYEELLANERENFKILYEKVSELGGIPLMLKSVDMSNTIPDEKVVVTYVSYLCGRLLDIRQESRAARVIQIAWRHYKLRTALRAQHHEIKAAQVIQTRVREFLQRRHTQRQTRATIVVQSVWRGRKARSEARLRRLARDNANMGVAVTKIQAAMLGFAAKRRYQRLRKSTLTLQAHIRGHLARRCVSKQHKAAGIIQSRFGSWMTARKDRGVFLAKRSAAITVQRAFRAAASSRTARTSAAAGVVQRAWRGYSCRKQLVDLRRSVLLLQGCVRMKKVRKEYLQLRKTAVTLQARVRANKLSTTARQDFLTKKKAVTTLQSHLRGYQQRVEYAHNRNAAICIQKHFRGHKYRVKFQAMRLAAIILQRAYRLHKMAGDEREVLLRQTAACVTVQRWWKLLQQRKMERRHTAAALIQATYRCQAARREFKRTQSAVLTLQTSFRRTAARAQFLRTKAAIIILQHYTRLHLNKRQIQSQMQAKRDAVVRLQTCWRRLQAQRQYGAIRQAVMVIQKNVRMMQAQIQYKNKMASVSCLQRHARGYLQRKAFLSDVAHRTSAAVRVQSWWRMLVSRQRFVSLRQSVVVIQAWVRGWHQRKDLMRQRKAALVIQSFYRATRATREARTRYQVMIGAAMAIQSGWRSYVIKKQFSIMRRSAVKIQSKVRMVLAMKRYHNLKHACVLLQRRYRANKMGQCVKQEFVQTKSAVVTLQAAFRGQRCRKQYQKTKMAAVKIQSHVRMVRAMKKYHNIRNACVLLQRLYRTHKVGQCVRQEFIQTKSAVVTLQATFRGQRCRKQYQKTKMAAVKIQSWVRMIHAMKKYHTFRNACIVLQDHYRAYKKGLCVRKAYQNTRCAVVTLQAAFRGQRCCRQYQKTKMAAVKIQSCVRMYQDRCKYRQIVQAACVLQRRLRALRAGQLDRRVYVTNRNNVIKLQAAVRAWICHRAFQKTRQAAVTIQKHVRMHQQRMRYRQLQQHVKMDRAAVVLQNRWRMLVERRRFTTMRAACICVQQQYRAVLSGRQQRQNYVHIKQAVVTLQTAYRAAVCRRDARRELSALLIQSHVRKHLIRSKFLCMKKSAIKLQACVRMIRERKFYRERKQAVCHIQQWYRSIKCGQGSRRAFLIMKGAAMTIQAVWRGYIVRCRLALYQKSATLIQAGFRSHQQQKQYRKLRATVVSLQKLYRNNKAAGLERQRFVQQKSASVVIQKMVKMFLVRRRFLQQKSAALTIQRAYQCYKERSAFIQQREAAKVIQDKWRSTLSARVQRKQYLILVGAAITIQQGYRSYQIRQDFLHTRCQIIRVQACVRAFLHRKRHQRLQQAARTIQVLCRRRCQTRKQRKEFLQMRSSVSVLQSAYRQWKHRQVGKRHIAATTIQSVFRMLVVKKQFCLTRQRVVLVQAVIRGFLARCAYCHKLQAISVIQRNARRFLLFKGLRRVVARRRRAVGVIQRSYRKYRHTLELKRQKSATLIQRAYKRHRHSLELKRQRSATIIQSTFRMHCIRKTFRQTCQAAILIESSWRGYMVRRTFRKTLQKHRAAVCLQRSYRGYKARVHLQKLQAERKAQLEMYAQRARVHLAAVRIQTWYRQCLMLRQARQRIASVVCIQRRVRAFLVRLHYVKLHESTVLLQRRCRQWLASRQRSAVVIQRAVRHWLVRQRQHQLHRQVARIQAVWRGYRARKSITCKKIRRARARCHEASQNATEDKKLGNRTTSALDYLLEYKSLSHILEALMHLDVATRLSPRCCQRLVEVHAVHVIYRLIRSCNRSLPHMELIKYSVNILLNLAKYDKTVNAVHDVESTDILVDLMQIYREKGSAIFAKTCSLLGILALDPHRRQEILQQTKLMEKIRSIQSLVARKNKVDERHKIVQAKMAATRSFNSTLPLPTPVKRRRIRPEWTLKRDSLHALSDPLPAINFVLENLHLSTK